jgi:hypothetical protein
MESTSPSLLDRLFKVLRRLRDELTGLLDEPAAGAGRSARDWA